MISNDKNKQKNKNKRLLSSFYHLEQQNQIKKTIKMKLVEKLD